MKQYLTKYFKKVFLVLFAILIPLSLVGCGNTQKDPNTNAIDIDLSSMSETMMYSYISNMIEKPDDYEGKYIKAKGVHKSYTNNQTHVTYHAILIYDSSTCCSQALEFVLDDDIDYPSVGKTITIEGTFGTYNEGKNTYCYLNNSKIS